MNHFSRILLPTLPRSAVCLVDVLQLPIGYYQTSLTNRVSDLPVFQLLHWPFLDFSDNLLQKRQRPQNAALNFATATRIFDHFTFVYKYLVIVYYNLRTFRISMLHSISSLWTTSLTVNQNHRILIWIWTLTILIVFCALWVLTFCILRHALFIYMYTYFFHFNYVLSQ